MRTRSTANLYAVVAHMRSVYRYGCTCLAIILIVWLWHSTVYTRIHNISVCKQSEVAQFQRDYTLMRVAYRERASLEKLVHLLNADIKKYSCPGGVCMSALIDCATSNGVTLMACSARESVDKEWYTTHTLSLKLQGSLSGVAQFFEVLAGASKIVSCSSLQVHKTAPQQFCAQCDISVISPKTA